MKTLYRLLWLVSFSLLMSTLSAQVVQDSLRQIELLQKMETIENIIASKAKIDKELKDKEKEYRKARSSEQKANISKEIRVLSERHQKLLNDFHIIATGIDLEAFFAKKEQDFDWNQELKDIMAPLVHELKDVTHKPREIDRLRTEMNLYHQKLESIDYAIHRLDTLGKQADNRRVRKFFEERGEFWKQYQQEYQNELAAIELQLKQLERQSRTPVQIIGDLFNVVFRSRGKNLLFAILIFVLSFFTLRFLHSLIYRFLPKRHQEEKQFFLRVADLIYYFLTLAVSIGLFLSVLYFSSDWILLVLSLAILLGLIWTGKNALPIFFQEVKLLLNIGPVREGERLVYNHVAWKVETLNLFVDLTNPDLQSGHLRLPLRDLIQLRSRPYQADEPWFPSQVGDWLVMADGSYGKVVSQTPEHVVLETQKGSPKTYPIEAFLEGNPQNLSRNHFSVTQTIGIDYKYRNRVNEEICPQIKAYFEDVLKKEAYGEHLSLLMVELQSMNASSLDLICLLKFNGDAAAQYREIGWRVQQIALDALNALDLEIPYPHIQLLGSPS